MKDLVERIQQDIVRLEAQLAEKPVAKPLTTSTNQTKAQSEQSALNGLLRDIKKLTADFRQASVDLAELKPINKMEREYAKLRDFRSSQRPDGPIWQDSAREQVMVRNIQRLAREVRGESPGIWV